MIEGFEWIDADNWNESIYIIYKKRNQKRRYFNICM